MSLSKYRMLGILFFLGCLLPLAAEEEPAASLRIAVSPALGFYRYKVLANEGLYSGALNSLSLEYARPLRSNSSLIAYMELSGQLYSGHEDSSHPVSRFWGLINGKFGGGIRLSQLVNPKLELSWGSTLYYALYIHNPESKWPGIGVATSLSLSQTLSPRFALGARASLSSSYHPGGPEPDSLGLTRYPFIILESGLSLFLGLRL